jgi:hypothetical protein
MRNFLLQSALKFEAAGFFKTSVSTQKTARSYNEGNHTLKNKHDFLSVTLYCMSTTWIGKEYISHKRKSTWTKGLNI